MFFVLVCGAFALASCEKESPAPEASSSVSIEVALPDDLKTVLGEKEGTSYPIYWQTGDVLTLNGVKSSPITVETPGKIASFTFDGVFDAPFNLLYNGKEGESDIVSFKTSQTYVPGSFDPDSAPMYASSGDAWASLKLVPLNSVLCFNLKSEAAETIKSIVVKAAGGEIIGGDFRIGSSSGLLNGSLTPVSGGSNTVSLNLGDGVTLTSAAEPFYVTIPAGTYSQGFTATVYTASESMELKFWSAEGKTVPAGKVYEFAAKEFEANGSGEEIIIADIDDLVAFSTSYASQAASSGKTFKVIADIDATGSSYKAVNNFYGTFDGCGHTISGLTGPLFSQVYGVIRNLTVEANFEYAGRNASNDCGTDYGIGILCHYVYCYIGGSSANGNTNALIENVTTRGSLALTTPTASAHAFQIGGIAGASNGVPIRNCTNYASISITDGYSVAAHTSGTTAFTLAIGGIVGTCQTTAGSSVTNCVNYGDVTAGQGGAGEGMYVGGIVGYHCKKASVEDCANYGKVEMSGNCSAGVSLGGIVGDSAATDGPTYTNDTNYGKVVFSGNVTTSTSYIGGIAGRPNNRLMTNLSNEGDIELVGTTGSVIQAGGIAGASILKESTGLRNSGDMLVSCNCSYVFAGGIAGYQGGYSINNVYNSGDITVDGLKCSAGTGMALGGIVGQRKGTHTLKDAVNDGNITVKSLDSGCASCRYDIGGLEGYAYKDDASVTYTYNGCKNNGKISIEDVSKGNPVRVGGLVGHVLIGTTDKAGKLIMTGCENDGEIYVKGGYGVDVYAGGIASDLRTASGSATFTDCVNKGAITLDGYAGKDRVCLGGIAGQSYYSTNTDTFDGCANYGVITLKEDTTDSKRPAAGGIIGMASGTSASAVLTLNIRNCTNNGNIERYITNASEIARTGSTNYPLLSVAGGIVGGLGYFNSGDGANCYVKASIESCTNNALVSFNRKKDTITGNPAEKNGDGENVYTGGIVGLSFTKVSNGIDIVNCVNNGRVGSNFSKAGGIVGIQRSNTAIRGTKNGDGTITYCVSNAPVGHPGVSIGTTGTVYGYHGGISGYVFGDGTNSIEYCYVTDNCWLSGNYGSGGLVGMLCSGSNYASPVIRYCKSKAKGRPSSTAAALVNGGKYGIAFGGVADKDHGLAALEKVSDLALGGTCYKYKDSKWCVVSLTLDNYANYIGAVSYCPNLEWAEAANVRLWDGSSATSWE